MKRRSKKPTPKRSKKTTRNPIVLPPIQSWFHVRKNAVSAPDMLKPTRNPFVSTPIQSCFFLISSAKSCGFGTRNAQTDAKSLSLHRRFRSKKSTRRNLRDAPWRSKNGRDAKFPRIPHSDHAANHTRSAQTNPQERESIFRNHRFRTKKATRCNLRSKNGREGGTHTISDQKPDGDHDTSKKRNITTLEKGREAQEQFLTIARSLSRGAPLEDEKGTRASTCTG